MASGTARGVPVYRLNEKPPPRYSLNDIFNFLFDNPEGKKFSDIKTSKSEVASVVNAAYEKHVKQHPVDLAAWGRQYPEKHKQLMRTRENKKKQKLKKDKVEEAAAEEPIKKKPKVTPAPDPPPQVPLRAQDVDSLIIEHLEFAKTKFQSAIATMESLLATTSDLQEKLLAMQ
jgi:hypothetical protein